MNRKPGQPAGPHTRPTPHQRFLTAEDKAKIVKLYREADMNVTDLAKRFGTTRIPIRDAIREMEEK